MLCHSPPCSTFKDLSPCSIVQDQTAVDLKAQVTNSNTIEGSKEQQPYTIILQYDENKQKHVTYGDGGCLCGTADSWWRCAKTQQIHFAFWTNTFWVHTNDKFIFKFGQIYLEICANTCDLRSCWRLFLWNSWWSVCGWWGRKVL